LLDLDIAAWPDSVASVNVDQYARVLKLSSAARAKRSSGFSNWSNCHGIGDDGC
jgi:hypothetical protein